MKHQAGHCFYATGGKKKKGLQFCYFFFANTPLSMAGTQGAPGMQHMVLLKDLNLRLAGSNCCVSKGRELTQTALPALAPLLTTCGTPVQHCRTGGHAGGGLLPTAPCRGKSQMCLPVARAMGAVIMWLSLIRFCLMDLAYLISYIWEAASSEDMYFCKRCDSFTQNEDKAQVRRLLQVVQESCQAIRSLVSLAG